VLTKVGTDPSVTIMILPRRNTQGMLEDLCLEAVKPDPATPCMEGYFRCLTRNGITTSNIAKAKIHTFLSSRTRPDLRLGEAALEGYWPFPSSVFDDLKQFLRMI
jgi:hypothetical protein